MGQHKSDNYERSKNIDTGHPSGLSPSDKGQFGEELEGSEKAFRMKPDWNDQSIPDNNDEAPSTSGDQAGWTAVAERDIELNADRGARVQKEDSDTLERQRVDQEDEIVGRYDPRTDGQMAELRPRETKKGTESEGL